MGDGVLTTTAPKMSDHATPDDASGAIVTNAESDEFIYDPSNPVPSVGGHSCCSWTSGPQGQFDQSAIEQRSDILVYSSQPLKDPLEVTGPITVTLYASSSAPDTDFTAKLVDAGPCGFARNLTDGIIRARVRESRSDPKLMVAGKVYEFKVDLWATANVFKAGHRVRLEISSSNFPRFDRNPNTGHELFADAEMRPALQSVM